MNLKYKILAVLAAGIALTACGGSGTPASTPASSAVPASSHVAEEGVTEPINLLTWTLDDLDDTQTTTFVSASITSGVQNGKLTAKVFSYDLYKKEILKPCRWRQDHLPRRGCGMESGREQCGDEHRKK